MTLVDTNVLLDLVTDDANRADWSIAQLEAASLNGPLLINDAVYAEPEEAGFHLIVAIADVAHYVRPGAPLDDAATTSRRARPTPRALPSDSEVTSSTTILL